MKKSKLTLTLTIVGILLMVVGVSAVIFSTLSASIAENKANEIREKLSELIPTPHVGSPIKDSSPMSVIELDGEDFVGIISVPAYDTSLPIHAKWESAKVQSYPCRYIGGIREDVLIIGGSDNKGQFDFIKSISFGDEVQITDVTGALYTYTVTDIRKTNDVSTENLTSKDADLILFTRNTYSLDYTVVRCTIGK